MSKVLSDPVRRRWLAAPLAIWGKLPSHGDFLRHRCSAAQANDWQNWVGSVWNQSPLAAPPARSRRPVRAGPGWLTLEPRKAAPDLGAVPVAFVMQPGALPFAPDHCVQGVLLASVDQIGRPCPLIIFQQIAPGWLRRSWAGKASAHQTNMLYWLARIAARTHAAHKDWEALTTAVDGMWQAHAPGWRQLLGAHLPAPSRLQLETLLHSYCEHESADAACGLQGVHRMPWAQWPTHILRTHQPMHAFWQQDIRGGYVNAGESLPALWGAHT
jgi:type VI secretion system protein ImpM